MQIEMKQKMEQSRKDQEVKVSHAELTQLYYTTRQQLYVTPPV